MFTVITTGAALQLGGTQIYFWFCTWIYLSFWLAQWEEYHTHVMEARTLTTSSLSGPLTP